MQAHGLEGGFQQSAAASPLVCLLDTEETSRVLLAFLLIAYSFLFFHRKRGWIEERRGFWCTLYRFSGFVLVCCYAVVGREMEENKSSFVDEFFPEKEAALPSKLDILSSIFPPRSPDTVKDSFHYEVSSLRARKQGNEGQRLTEQKGGASSGSFRVRSGKNQDGPKKNNDPNAACEIEEPCLMSSSVYYGGRDDFIPGISSSYKSGSSYTNKKDSEDGSNSDVASPGDWWQGSFYY